MNRGPDQREFASEFQRAIGKRIWSYTQGPFFGSDFHLHFGAQRRITYSSETLSALTARLRKPPTAFEGEYILFVTCDWQLRCPDRAVRSDESPEPDGPIDRALAELVDKSVVDVHFDRESLGLRLDVEMGYTLELSGRSADGEDADAYVFFTPSESLAVQGDGSLCRESRSV